jgi:peroxiredoxin
MKLSVNQQVPKFTAHDVSGISLDSDKLRGKNVFLVFQRNAGCPVCNLRTNQLLKESQFFTNNNVVVILVYESGVSKLREYLGDDAYPFHFVADPKNVLYDAFAVEKSFAKLMKGTFHGLLSKAMAGKKLYQKPISQDGNTSRIPAEFLIDTKGKVLLAHYDKFLGDDLPMNTLKRAVLEPLGVTV